ncbi:MAG: YCF48-related protein [Woeseiaceae bacterium]|nr:YCF48-related protein [Woeseiaceae bacterium]
MRRKRAAHNNKRLAPARTAALQAAVLVVALGWIGAGHGEPTEFAMLPSLESELVQESLLLDFASSGERRLVAGESGHILYSDDDGQSWTQADVPVSLTVTSVAFGGPNEAWATAHDGFLLHSSDNGSTWEIKLTGSDVARLSVSELEEKIEAQRAELDNATAENREDLEWALDDTMFALEEATAAIDEGMTSPMLNIWFANNSEGYALGAYGVFLHTVDGGETWKMESNRLDNPDKYHLYGIARSSAGTLLVAGEAGTLLRSTDDGASWERVDYVYAGSFFDAVAVSDGSLLIFGLRGNVFRSTDEGASWSPVQTGDQRTLMSGMATDDGTVVLAGAAGAVLISRDGGATFRTIPTEGGLVYSDVSMRSDGSLMLAGFGGISVIDPMTGNTNTEGQ